LFAGGDAQFGERVVDVGFHRVDWVVRDLADAIHAAAAETPLAIVLEDIHWADNGTLLALRSLATARPDVPVLWLLRARTGAGGPAGAGDLVGAAARECHILARGGHDA
jgi:predicted ATPase